MEDTFKPEDEAAFYNKHPILDVLKTYFESNELKTQDTYNTIPSKVLEISSGSGQHAKFFSENLPQITHYQPTEYDTKRLPIIKQLNDLSKVVLPTKLLDVCNLDHWNNIEDNYYDFSLVTNLCHISAWECTVGMFEGISRKLMENSHFLIYGPFKVDFEFTTESNRIFDEKLRMKDITWGLRDVSDIVELGKNVGMIFQKKISMPENNFMLVFKKMIRDDY